MNAMSQKVRERSKRGRAVRPALDVLEARLTLSSASSLHAAQAVGAIEGQVIDGMTGNGVRHVQVQLLNGAGRVVGREFTDASGRYEFNVGQAGPYVVREVTPRGFVQTSPTFVSAAPTGSLVPGAGNNSWDYGTNTDPTQGPVGPDAWSTIAPAGLEPFESPINITTPAVDLSRVLTVNYNNAVPKQIINNGHQIQVQFNTSANDTVTAGGQVYNLAQFHYHGPAENTVHGRQYTAEEHFVNTSASGAETVVAVFLKLGAHNDALDPILNAALTKLTAPNTSTKITTPINFAGLLPTNMRGWYYQGSLTTPPLSQPVNWFVFQTPITLDFTQLQEYEQVASNSGFLPNNRPVQPTDGRRLNEVDNLVNFQGPSVTGVNFTVAPRTAFA